MIRKLIISLIFLVGMSIFFYPIISNWLSTKDHHTVITKYNEAVKNVREDDLEQIRSDALEFNDSLTETALPISDPFEVQETGAENTGYYSMLNIGPAMGSLEIPKINVKLPIYHGVGEEVLERGIGHMSNSSLPVGGANTHAALTGHRGLPSSKLFRNLDKLLIDDEFYIDVLGERLTYRVDDIKIVLPSETSWLEMVEDKDYVTLITCEPYMINTHRLLVRGERVLDGEVSEEVFGEIDSPGLIDDSEKNNKKVTPLLIGIGSVGTIILILLYIREMRRRKRNA